VRRNYGSNDSATNAAPRKVVMKFEASKSKEKGFALRKSSTRTGFPPSSSFHALKSTINNFSKLARFNPVERANGSENVSSTLDRQPAAKNMPLRDITKQVHHLNEELENEYHFDMVQTSSTESNQKEEFAQFVIN
jgi:hypothetical protein